MRGPRNLEYTRHVLRFRGRAPSRPQTTIIKSFLVADGLARLSVVLTSGLDRVLLVLRRRVYRPLV